MARPTKAAQREATGEASREEQLYTAALTLFREKGYHATSMQDIAEVVGVYKGSLYHYISGKEDLLLLVFERAMADLLLEMEAIATDAAVPATTRLRRAIHAHVRAVASNQDGLIVYLHEWRALAGARAAHVAAQRERYAELLADIVAAGVRSGEFRPVDIRIATFGILGMCNWLSQWFRAGGRLTPEAIAEQFADMALGALGILTP